MIKKMTKIWSKKWPKFDQKNDVFVCGYTRIQFSCCFIWTFSCYVLLTKWWSKVMSNVNEMVENKNFQKKMKKIDEIIDRGSSLSFLAAVYLFWQQFIFSPWREMKSFGDHNMKSEKNFCSLKFFTFCYPKRSS